MTRRLEAGDLVSAGIRALLCAVAVVAFARGTARGQAADIDSVDDVIAYARGCYAKLGITEADLEGVVGAAELDCKKGTLLPTSVTDSLGVSTNLDQWSLGHKGTDPWPVEDLPPAPRDAIKDFPPYCDHPTWLDGGKCYGHSYVQRFDMKGGAVQAVLLCRHKFFWNDAAAETAAAWVGTTGPVTTVEGFEVGDPVTVVTPTVVFFAKVTGINPVTSKLTLDAVPAPVPAGASIVATDGDRTFNDIAMIIHDRRSGNTCWFNTPEPGKEFADRRKGLDGRHVPFPHKNRVNPPTGALFWDTPEAVAGIRCIACHDNGPWMNSYWVRKSGVVPGDPPSEPYVNPGKAFRTWPKRVKQVIVPDPADGSKPCFECHRISVRIAPGNLKGGTCDRWIHWTTGGGIPAHAFFAAHTSENGKKWAVSGWMPTKPHRATAAAWDASYRQHVQQILDCCRELGEEDAEEGFRPKRPGVPAFCDPDDRHFQCYEIKRTLSISHNVSLHDQFIDLTAATLGKQDRLCAPARKNDESGGALDGDHLTGYRVAHPVPFTAVPNQLIVNQFGSVMVDVVAPDRVLVPSAKSLEATPMAPMTPSIDHFQCYKVLPSHGAAKFVPRAVKVKDQFGELMITLKRPVRLCAPVNKDDEDPGAEDRVEHLLCYKTAPTTFPTKKVFLNDQFGPTERKLIRRTELCVPSLKNPPATTTTTSTSSTSSVSATSSTTTSTIATACCALPPGTFGQPLPVCFDAVAPDVDVKCPLLGGTVVAGFCDPWLSDCVPDAPTPTGDVCCECPVPSPPFPHPRFCFETVFGEEGKCDPGCTLTTGVTCGPVSERCGGSPSGAFVALDTRGD